MSIKVDESLGREYAVFILRRMLYHMRVTSFSMDVKEIRQFATKYNPNPLKSEGGL